MKLTMDKLNELHVSGKINDLVYAQYSTLLINAENIECNIDYDGRISFRLRFNY